MPRFAGLFDAPSERVAIVDDGAGNRTLREDAVTEALFDFAERSSRSRLTPNADGPAVRARSARKYAGDLQPPNEEFNRRDGPARRRDRGARRRSIAYLQKLGMNRGKWRDLFEPQQLEASDVRRCRARRSGSPTARRSTSGAASAATASTGDGNGPAATFMYKYRPRDFHAGRVQVPAHVKGPLPTDGDLLRTITRGVRGTAMPPWYELPLEDRLAVIQYIKYELAVDRSDPSAALRLLRRGAAGAAALHRRAARRRRRSCSIAARRSGSRPSAGSATARAARATARRRPGLKDDLELPDPSRPTSPPASSSRGRRWRTSSAP